MPKENKYCMISFIERDVINGFIEGDSGMWISEVGED